MKTSKLLHPDMGDQVLKRLGKLVDTERLLTTGGVIAGQSVASAIAEIVQSPHATVFNDVDLFRKIKDSENRTKRNRILDPFVQTDAYLTHAYNQILACEDFHYKVQRTTRDGFLNEVLCIGHAFDRTADLAAASVLASFDLNCVQVGVNLETKKLLWTPAYELFLHTQELLVENVRTPVHTAIRWFRKKAELEGVFGNDERTMQMLAIVGQLLRPGENASAQTQGQLNFSTPYMEKLEDVRRELSTWFNVEDSVRAWRLPEKSVTESPTGIETKDGKARLQKQGDIPLYTLRPRFDPPTGWVPSHLSYRFSVPIIRAKQGFWKKHICEQILDAASREDTIQHMHLLVHGAKAFEKPHAPRALASLNKSLKQHRLNDMFYRLPLDKALVVNDALKALAEEKGLFAYGVIENMHQGEFARGLPDELDAAKMALTEIVDQRLVEMRKLKSIAPVVPELDLPGGYRLVELTTLEEFLEEGSFMRHCVGGYYPKVSKGEARVLSLRPTLRKHSLTVECIPKGPLFSTRQVHGVTNRAATDKEAEVGRIALNALNICSLLRWLPANRRKQAVHYVIAHPEWGQKLTRLNDLAHSLAPKENSLAGIASGLRVRVLRKVDNLVTKGLLAPSTFYALKDSTTWEVMEYWGRLTKWRLQGKKAPAPKGLRLGTANSSEYIPEPDDIPF